MVATSWCDLDLIIDIAIVTLTLKSCPGYIMETIRVRSLYLGGTLIMCIGVQCDDVTLV